MAPAPRLLLHLRCEVVISPLSNLECRPFGSGSELKGRLFLGDRFGDQAIEGGIVVAGVMVKGDEVPGPGECRKLNGVAKGAVSPTNALGVF